MDLSAEWTAANSAYVLIVDLLNRCSDAVIVDLFVVENTLI